MTDSSETFVESIWIKNHRIQLLDFHQRRFENTCKKFAKQETKHKLIDVIDRYAMDTDDIKCRIIYNCQRIVDVQYQMYSRRSIKLLKVLEKESVIYDYKMVKRPELDSLWSERECGDEIIITKKGVVTDAYYFNLVFDDGSKLYTPSECLLKGVRREYYIAKNKIFARTIKCSNFSDFKSVHLINALNPLGFVEVDIENIVL